MPWCTFGFARDRDHDCDAGQKLASNKGETVLKCAIRLGQNRFGWLILSACVGFVLALSFVAAAQGQANDTCFSCHDTEGFANTLDNGDEMNLYVPRNTYLNSIHGAAELSCDNCHEGYVEYPHPEKTFVSQRGFAVQANESCVNCHPDEAASYQNEFHGKTLAMRKLRSAATGKAITTAPEATCTDCHGSHNILPATDQASQVHPDNLTTTCQNCHEKATPQFVVAFTKHTKPAPTDPQSAVTYWINLAYQIAIPALLGTLFLFMLLELAFMLRKRQHKTLNQNN